MISPLPVPRYLGLLVLLAMAGFAAVGFHGIRRDVENLRIISQDNTQWQASQMELELLRYRLALAELRTDASSEARDEMIERFDILWSRVFMVGNGPAGERLQRYDSEFGSVRELSVYLKEIDPLESPIDPARIGAIEDRLAGFQTDLQHYALQVMRAEGAAASQLRDRIRTSARTTALVSVAAVLLSVLSLILILRENRRQLQIAEMHRRSAAQAEQASQAKSRFLTMMSHEMRNPLNGVLGPLALLGQDEISEQQRRLVQQARASGQTMLQMLTGLLEYGEMQDGRFELKTAPLRVAALADAVRDDLRAEGADVEVSVLPSAPERIRGDIDRLRQALVHLTLYALEGREPTAATVRLGHDGQNLVGDIVLAPCARVEDRRLDLLTGLTGITPDQITAEALRPLIARGMISATRGALAVVAEPGGGRTIRVTVPADPVRLAQIRVYLETKSAALATIYQTVLRGERVAFVPNANPGAVDVVLVDSTSVGESPLMSRLRARFPEALFVSLGLPQAPDFFDDIIEAPGDVSRLRTSILGRLAL